MLDETLIDHEPLAALRDAAQRLRRPLLRRGRVTEALGSLVRATGLDCGVGQLVELRSESGGSLPAEVVGVSGDHALLAPFGDLHGLSRVTEVVPMNRPHLIPVGAGLLGHVLNGFGTAFLDRPNMPVPMSEVRPIQGESPNPMQRRAIDRCLSVGVRAIDGLLTCGVGQRIGLFAPAGCGKSTLLAMMARRTQADVNVVALVGERGREVGEFINDTLGPAAMARTVVVAATSDRPAIERMRAAYVATTIAEHFREQGGNVLLMVDSVTRVARAMREIGLSAGEPPTRRGYPPSVFAQLPRLLERAGASAHGTITGFYTVLEETDDGQDPISEEVRSLLDGHILLSRKLAKLGHFPAIDILTSASRLMPRVADALHQQQAIRVRELWARYAEIELLIQIGEYKQGEDVAADEAVARHPSIQSFLRQGIDQPSDLLDARSGLEQLAS